MISFNAFITTIPIFTKYVTKMNMKEFKTHVLHGESTTETFNVL